MAKAKTVEVELKTDYLTMEAVSASGKNTVVVVEGITTSDILHTAQFQIKDGFFYIIKGDKGVKLSNYKGIKDLWLDVYKQGDKIISYTKIDLYNQKLSDGSYTCLVDNYDFGYKKTSLTGTSKANDIIDATTLGYAPTGKNIAKNKGLTISAKGGNDTITGTQYNDTISGGKGRNTVIYNSNTFGSDTIKLTKGETLILKFEGDLSGVLNPGTDYLSYVPAKNNKDLVITVNTLDGEKNNIIIKNYYKKELGAKVWIYNNTTNGYMDVAENFLLPEVNAGNYFQVEGQKIKKSFGGSALQDKVNASGMTVATNVKKNTGVTINGGAGKDILVGSRFNDTIKGGKGDDFIQGYRGNDKLYGVSGNNTFAFRDGDGVDTLYAGKGTENKLDFSETSLADIHLTKGVKKAARNLILSYGEGDSVTLKNFFTKKGAITPSIKEIVTKEGTFTFNDLVLGNDRIESTDGKSVVLFSNDQTITCKDGKNYFVYPQDDSDINVKFGTSTLDNLDITTDGTNVIIKGSESEGSVTLCEFGTNPSNVTVTGADNASKSIIAGSGNVNGTNSDDIIFGSDKADYIVAGNGADILIGGAGDDVLKGDKGNDTYLFKSGHGKDSVIYSNGDGVDVLKFSDFDVKDMFLTKSGDNVVIKDGKDQVTLQGYTDNSIIVQGADGVQYTLNKTDKSLSLHNASNGDDIFYSVAGGNNFAGGAGKNTYIISKGSGNCDIVSTSGTDVVKFTDVKFDEIKSSVKVNGKNIEIGYSKNSADKVVIDGFFVNQKDVRIVTSDNQPFNLVDALNAKFGSGTVNGDKENNYIAGSAGNDTITGGKGSDRLFGLGGNDTYVFNNGDGNDIVDAREVVAENNRNDVLYFKDSALNELSYAQNGNNLVILYNNGADSVTVYDYFKEYDSTGENNKVTKIKVKDGSVHSLDANVVSEYSQVKDGYSYLTGTVLNDIFTSTSNNEVMTGFGGKNTYNFATGGGTDYIFTTSGKDVINFTDVTLDSISFTVNSNKLLVFSYGSGNDKVLLQDYLKNRPDVTITDKNGATKTVAQYLSAYEAEHGSLGANINSYMQDVAGWVESDSGLYQDANVVSDYTTEDLTAVFVNA